ncbi:MAG: electron transfer flavoprotein subunit beta/FixA family protein [Clostridiales Family XIII bacterium]|jgi:electron transfer flavoprotein beta subunit|nr:electron transfer flavoprotein subunit beta/FixA family protein [Clostridiales Family XIII bacterium]
MNLLVCVKQVPDTETVEIDEETHTLRRGDAPATINPFDAFALEAALRLAEAAGGRITVLSMGPKAAESTLRHCLAVGADRGVLLSDIAFAGADSLATARTLSAAIKFLEARDGRPFDVIFCGKKAIDGDTAQVGPEMAEFLDIPQITSVYDVEYTDGTLRFLRKTDVQKEVSAARTPLLVTVMKTDYQPRYPTLKGKLAARNMALAMITNADLELDEATVGLKGSPTTVLKTAASAYRRTCVRIDDEPHGDTAARKLTRALLKI